MKIKTCLHRQAICSTFEDAARAVRCCVEVPLADLPSRYEAFFILPDSAPQPSLHRSLPSSRTLSDQVSRHHSDGPSLHRSCRRDCSDGSRLAGAAAGQVYDNEKAKTLLGWRPVDALEEYFTRELPPGMPRPSGARL